MSALDKLNFLISTYGRLFVAMFNVRLWPPFLIYFIVMLLLVFIIHSMFSPLLSGWVIPLAVAASSEAALHYPQHLQLLLSIFEWFNFVPSVLLQSLLMTAAMLMFAAYYSREKVSFRKSLRQAASYYPKILLIWIINFILIYVLFKTLPSLFREYTGGSPRRLMALVIGMQGLSVLLTALFVYVLPYLVIKKRAFWRCFSGSFSLFFKNFFTTYFFVLIPQTLIIALVLLLQNQDMIIEKFHPRVLVGLTYLYVFLLAVIDFFIYGAIVRFFLEIAED